MHDSGEADTLWMRWRGALRIRGMMDIG